MRQSFGAVRVEDLVTGDPIDDETQLPRQVGGVAYARAQTLAEERWHLVCGVAGEEHPPRSHRVGNGGTFVEYTSDIDRISAQDLYRPEDWQGHEFLDSFGPPPPPEFLEPADMADLIAASH